MTHDELVLRGVRWLRHAVSGPRKRTDGVMGRFYRPACGVVVPELVSYAPENPDVIGWVAGQSYLIECKTSRSDYYADKRKHSRVRGGAGSYRYYLSAPDVVTPDILYPGWGLLHCYPRKISIVVEAPPNPRHDPSSEILMLYSLLRRVEVRGGLSACLAPKWGGDGALSGSFKAPA